MMSQEDLMTQQNNNESFLCKMCKEFLCNPVMLVQNLGDICGSCYELNYKNTPNELSVTNNKTIETILSKMQLPCKYVEYGCKFILNYSDKRQHEKKYCMFRIQQCPVINLTPCNWKGSFSMLEKHMFEEHKELVIQSKSESSSNIFLMEIEVFDMMENSDARSKSNYKLLIIDQYKFILKLSIHSSYLHYDMYKAFTNDQFTTYHLKLHTEVNNVQWSAGKESNVKPLYTLVISEEVEKMDMIPFHLQSFSKFESQKIQLKVRINVPQSNIIDNGDKILECPVCMKVMGMGAPIYLCSNGHSVCGNCRPKLKHNSCPTCKANMTDGRNYVVEELVSRKSVKCKYASKGCTKVSVLEKITKHEQNCELGRNGRKSINIKLRNGVIYHSNTLRQRTQLSSDLRSDRAVVNLSM